MLSRCFPGCLLLLALSLPVYAGPDCRTMGATVQESEQHDMTFLTREDLNAVKKCLENELATNGKPRWKKKDGSDMLIVFCPKRKNPDMEVAEVALAVEKRQAALDFLAVIQPQDTYKGDIYSFLAERTGRSKQEAVVLREKYAKLGYFRSIKTPDGREVSEAGIISERHKKKLGITKPKIDKPADDKERRAELKRKIKEAKQRGDKAEALRLATEALQDSAPLMEKVNKATDQAYEDSWRLMESQYPDLLQASYPVRFSYMPDLCM